MITTIKRLRSKLLELLTHKFALPIIARFRKTTPFPYSMEDLLQFPEGTLGKDLVLYLQKKEFKLIKGYERHDCKHIILQYEMDEKGEACMQFYFFGNRHYSLPVVSTVFICFFLMPEQWRNFYKEYKKGKHATTFDNVDFNQIILMNTNDLRKQFKTNKK